MELNLERSNAPVRDAATVVLLRDAPAGLEVFMLRRHVDSDVLGGVYVFPGGKVDASDASLDARGLIDVEPEALPALLGENNLDIAAAGAIFSAAVREAREECGVRLRASDLIPWVRWITPAVGGVMRKRFDTRFFLARHPEGQELIHDNHEATASAWLRPRDALAMYWSREISLAPPQLMSLAHLSKHPMAALALAEARHRVPPLVHPEPFGDEENRGMCYPGDPGHSVRARALPGPSRLHYRNGRFEPDPGFEGFFEDR